jgi:hypothetical protein
MDWLVAQCRAQRLNVILCTRSTEDAAPLRALLDAADIRAQVLALPHLSAQEICFLAQDRRVRWIVLPIATHGHAAPLPGLVEDVLSQAGCPVLLLPHPSLEPESQ